MNQIGRIYACNRFPWGWYPWRGLLSVPWYWVWGRHARRSCHVSCCRGRGSFLFSSLLGFHVPPFHTSILKPHLYLKTTRSMVTYHSMFHFDNIRFFSPTKLFEIQCIRRYSIKFKHLRDTTSTFMKKHNCIFFLKIVKLQNVKFGAYRHTRIIAINELESIYYILAIFRQQSVSFDWRI